MILFAVSTLSYTDTRTIGWPFLITIPAISAASGVARHVGQLLAHLRPSRFKVVVLDRLGVVGGYLGRLHLLARPHGRRGGEQGLRHALREIGPVLQRKLEHSHMRELLEAEQRDEVELLGFLEQLFSRLAQRADELALADHGLERLAQEIDRGIGVAGDCRSVLPDRGAGGKRQAI